MTTRKKKEKKTAPATPEMEENVVETEAKGIVKTKEAARLILAEPALAKSLKTRFGILVQGKPRQVIEGSAEHKAFASDPSIRIWSQD